MAVKSRAYRAALERETRKKQPLMKAHNKAAVRASASKPDKWDRPSWLDKKILAYLKKLHNKKKGKK